MKFSIIIPVYNVEKFLTKCIDSVLQQTFSDYEIIAVNDGSTDSSGEILQTYQKKYSQLTVVEQQNRGLGGARNTGIYSAKGEYIVFLDSDDYISPNLLEEAHKYIEKYDLDILAFDCNLVDLDGHIIQCATIHEYSDKYTVLTQKQYLLLEPTSCTKIYRRSIYIENNIRFPEKLWYEDLATVFRLTPFIKNIGYLKEPLYYYVQHNSSITHSSNVKRMMEIKEAFNHNVIFFKEMDLWNEYVDELEWNCILHVLYYSAFRLLGCGYHRKEMQNLYVYSKSIFHSLESNVYLRKNIGKKYLLDLIAKKQYFLFYLKTGFSIKYVNPLKVQIKGYVNQYEHKKKNT